MADYQGRIPGNRHKTAAQGEEAKPPVPLPPVSFLPPRTNVVHLQDGRGSEFTPSGEVVEIPKDVHLTLEECREMQSSDFALSNYFLKLGNEPDADKSLDDRLLAAEKGFANRMGLAAAPQIVVNERNAGFATIPDIGSGFTREGTPYISLNRVALKTWTPAQLESVLALETSRLKHGDAAPERVVATVDNQNLAFQDTFRADREAAGPMGTNNPRALIEALSIGEKYRVDALKKAGAIDLRDPEHPPLEERVRRLDQQAKSQNSLPFGLR